MSVFLPGSTLGNALVLHTPTEAQKLERSPDDGARLHLVLNSGVELKVRAIRLYDENDLAKLNAKKAEAMKLFEGVSTGLGAIGSIGWVLAASVVIGAAEAAMSSSAATAGARLLAEAIQMEKWLRGRGVFLPVGKISNIENPLPGFWRRKYEKADKVRFNTAAGEQIEMDTSQSALIHNGDEFLTVQTDDGSIRSIRWSTAERYRAHS